MILADLANSARTDTIGAAVTYVCHIRSILTQENDRQRGPHTLKLWVRCCRLEQCGIGTLDGTGEHRQRIIKAALVIVRADCVDGELTRYSARFLASHPIGDEGEHPELRPLLSPRGVYEQYPILILRAHTAN